MKRLVEIRSYQLKFGTRTDFHEAMESAAIPMVRRAGMDVVAFGPSAHDPNAYFLVRAYKDLADLQGQQGSFYGSEAWLQGPSEFLISRIEHCLNTVLWLSENSIQDIRASNVFAIE